MLYFFWGSAAVYNSNVEGTGQKMLISGGCTWLFVDYTMYVWNKHDVRALTNELDLASTDIQRLRFVKYSSTSGKRNIPLALSLTKRFNVADHQSLMVVRTSAMAVIQHCILQWLERNAMEAGF